MLRSAMNRDFAIDSDEQPNIASGVPFARIYSEGVAKPVRYLK